MAVTCKEENGALLGQEKVTTKYLLALHAETLPACMCVDYVI